MGDEGRDDDDDKGKTADDKRAPIYPCSGASDGDSGKPSVVKEVSSLGSVTGWVLARLFNNH